jgi:hypothetical protein
LTAPKIAEENNVNRRIDGLILTKDVNMRKVLAKVISENLSSEQDSKRKEICSDFFNKTEELNVLENRND